MRKIFFAAAVLLVTALPVAADGPSFTDLESTPTTSEPGAGPNSGAFAYVCEHPQPTLLVSVDCYSPVGVGEVDDTSVDDSGPMLYAYGKTPNGKTFCVVGAVESIEALDRFYPVPVSIALAANCMAALHLGMPPDLYFLDGGRG